MLSAVQTSVCVDASIDLFFSIFQHFSSSLEKTLELLWTAQDRKRHKKRRKERGISLSLSAARVSSPSLSLSLLRAHLLLPLWECATQTRRCLRPPLLRPSDADPPPRARRSQQIWRTKMSSRRVTSRNTIARRIVGSSCTIACTT